MKENKDYTVELLNLYKRYLEQANQQEIDIIGYHVNEHDNSGGHPDYHNNSHDNTIGTLKVKRNVTNKHLNKANS